MKYKNKEEAIKAITDADGNCTNPHCKGHDGMITITLRLEDLRKIVAAADYYKENYVFDTIEIKREKQSMDLHSVRVIQWEEDGIKFIKLF